MLDSLADERETIIIPTPVLCEFLILAGADGPKYLAKIDKASFFRIEPFDTKAAVELAAIEVSIRSSKSGRAKKREDAQGTWAKIKFDRQIVTIAKVNQAFRIYSDDEGVEKFAKRCGISVVKTWELPLPDVRQPSLFDTLEGQILEGDKISEERSPIRTEETIKPEETAPKTKSEED